MASRDPAVARFQLIQPTQLTPDLQDKYEWMTPRRSIYILTIVVDSYFRIQHPSAMSKYHVSVPVLIVALLTNGYQTDYLLLKVTRMRSVGVDLTAKRS